MMICVKLLQDIMKKIETKNKRVKKFDITFKVDEKWNVYNYLKKWYDLVKKEEKKNVD